MLKKKSISDLTTAANCDSFIVSATPNRLNYNKSPMKESQKEDKVLVQEETGKLSDFKVFFSVLKGFCSCAILLVPNAFYNGGWAFTTVVMLTCMGLNLITCLILLEVSDKYPGTFSELGYLAYGTPCKIVCDLALSISQASFVSAFVVFIIQNSDTIVLHLWGVTIDHWILGGIVFLILCPLTWVRNIETYNKWHIFCECSTIAVLFTIICFGIAHVTEEGKPSDVRAFNSDNCVVVFGTCIYLFEGTGLILPLKKTAKNPQNFSKVMVISLCIFMAIVLAFGFSNYFSYGDKILRDSIIITKALPQDNIILHFIRMVYFLCLFITAPLMLYPSNTIVESYLFRKNDKNNHYWHTNITRTIIIILITFIAVYFEETLDRLMSIVGSLTCTPVAFTLPAIIHLKLVAKTKTQITLDIFLITLSCFILTFVTGHNLYTWT
ncbi:unnamed protein product [Moneuplotes crassus]|uniref:Amino acid transporter transmembrane domain-containing protein n=1 Tax=Euplotes crassus TaxID=5936 RepID=A0AAD1XG77_EUPCR|nr:unnamed protein product [Moneuplotes crassus]